MLLKLFIVGLGVALGSFGLPFAQADSEAAPGQVLLQCVPVRDGQPWSRLLNLTITKSGDLLRATVAIEFHYDNSLFQDFALKATRTPDGTLFVGRNFGFILHNRGKVPFGELRAKFDSQEGLPEFKVSSPVICPPLP